MKGGSPRPADPRVTTHAGGIKPGRPCHNQTAARMGSEIAALRLTARVARPSGCSDAFSSAFQVACSTAATRTNGRTARGTGRVYRGGGGRRAGTSTDTDILGIRERRTDIEGCANPPSHLARHELLPNG